MAACALRNLVHGFLHNVWHRIRMGICRHRCLVIHTGVLPQTSHDRMLRVETKLTEFVEILPRENRFHRGVANRADGTHCTGCAGAIEPMHKWHRGPQRSDVGHNTQVHDLLRIAATQQSTICGPHGHDVRMATEDGQSLLR